MKNFLLMRGVLFAVFTGLFTGLLSLAHSLQVPLAGTSSAAKNEAAKSKPLQVAVAANLQPAMDKLKDIFSQNNGSTLQIVPGSSGKLVAQIREGAPFHVFLSADMAYPESLYVHQLAVEKPVPYALGKLVLAISSPKLKIEQGLALLERPEVKKIAIADPSLAPYGAEAQRALEKAGLWPRVQAKMVLGNNIGATAQYVAIGAADAGFLAKSTVLAPDFKKRFRWVDIDPALYQPIAQGMVLLKKGQEENPKLAGQFLEFMHSPEAKAVLVEFGYGLPGEQTGITSPGEK